LTISRNNIFLSRPNLAYFDFLQEGWRLENKDIFDKQSKLVIKGVVYNEMKGAFSENAQVFSQNLLNNIFPDHTYRHVSGGNPLEIPKLAYNDLVEFHKKYYHPSNARIYSYGLFDDGIVSEAAMQDAGEYGVRIGKLCAMHSQDVTDM